MKLQLENASAAHPASPSTPAKPNVSAQPPLHSTIPTQKNVSPALPLESGTTRPTPVTAPSLSPTEIQPLETADPAPLPIPSGMEKPAFHAQQEQTSTEDADAAAAVHPEWATTPLSIPAPSQLDRSIGIISQTSITTTHHLSTINHQLSYFHTSGASYRTPCCTNLPSNSNICQQLVSIFHPLSF